MGKAPKLRRKSYGRISLGDSYGELQMKVFQEIIYLCPETNAVKGRIKDKGQDKSP